MTIAWMTDLAHRIATSWPRSTIPVGEWINALDGLDHVTCQDAYTRLRSDIADPYGPTIATFRAAVRAIQAGTPTPRPAETGVLPPAASLARVRALRTSPREIEAQHAYVRRDGRRTHATACPRCAAIEGEFWQTVAECEEATRS